MMLLPRMMICVIPALFLSKSLLSEEVHTDAQASGSKLQTELLDWCSHVKRELSEQRIFDTKAVFPPADVDAEDIRFIDFESIRIPYVVDESVTISVRRGPHDSPQLRISYESGLRVFAAPILRNPIHDVFDKIVPKLPDKFKDYVSQRFGSNEDFTTQAFGGATDLAQLRFEGYGFTTDDIDCSENFEETVRRVAVIIASASADYSAVIAGDDVAYWSGNSVPGVVIRQEVPVSRGDLGPRILWSGEFFADDGIWQVIISFSATDQDRYDRLGSLLANPGSR